jgi:hypothetical protein
MQRNLLSVLGKTCIQTDLIRFNTILTNRSQHYTTQNINNKSTSSDYRLNLAETCSILCGIAGGLFGFCSSSRNVFRHLERDDENVVTSTVNSVGTIALSTGALTVFGLGIGYLFSPLIIVAAAVTPIAIGVTAIGSTMNRNSSHRDSNDD